MNILGFRAEDPTKWGLTVLLPSSLLACFLSKDTASPSPQSSDL